MFDMPIARMIVPFSSGSAQFPGVDASKVSYVCVSYVPPPPGTAPYALVELNAPQDVIDALAARPDCLYLCAATEAGFDAAPLPAVSRSAIRAKIEAMGFKGAQYGLVNAAVQASQNRDELVIKLGEAAFFETADKKPLSKQANRDSMLSRG